MAQLETKWWKADDNLVATQLWGYANRLRERYGDAMRGRFERNARLYGNETLQGLGLSSYTTLRDDSTMRLNVIKAVIDTIVSKISSNRPAPQFLTNGADYKTRRKTQKLNKFGKGVLHQSGVYDIGSLLLRDACVFGYAITKLYGDDNRICAERVYPWELFTDAQESYYGKPRTFVQRKYIDRDVLLSRFGGGKQSTKYKAILGAKASDRDDVGRDLSSDQLLVVEGWRLPTSYDGKLIGGRHCIVIEGNVVLLDEEWKRANAPFAIMAWDDALIGMWGRGICDSLVPIQYEINVLLKKIQAAFALLGIPRILLDMASGIPVAHLNNSIGAILQYRAGTQKPEVIAPQTIHPEIFSHLWALYARAFEQEGVSQMSASASKPPGIDSGEALREYGDQTSERFVEKMRRWEKFHMDIVERAIELVREMPNVKVGVPMKGGRDDVAWKDVAVEEDRYILQVFPISLLPQQPAGRQQKIEEMLSAQLISPDQAKELMDFPDMEGMFDEINAPRASIRQRIDRMLDGEYISPEPFDVAAGPQSPAVTLVLATYLLEREMGAPEDVLQLLRDWLSECNALLTPAAPGAPQQAAQPVAPVQQLPQAQPQQMTPPQQMAA